MALMIFKFENVDNGRRAEGGPLVYYKLILWAFGSGELKIYSCQFDFICYNFI